MTGQEVLQAQYEEACEVLEVAIKRHAEAIKMRDYYQGLLEKASTEYHDSVAALDLARGQRKLAERAYHAGNHT